MKATFNILDRAWIPAVDLAGHREKLGLRELLSRAHELREVSEASPMEEYGIYRFLSVFLMDALRPETESDIEDLLDEGRFDMERIKAYIFQCQEEGVSFDLFDEKRPFLQSPYDEAVDGVRKPVGVLDYTLPSGNNHVHFDHRNGDSLCLEPDQAARLLIAVQLFCTAGAQGYPSGVNASPPYFEVIRGKSLCETLLYTLVPRDWIGIEFDAPPVLWREQAEIIPKRTVPKTSWLRGMLFPARRVHLIPDQAGQKVVGLTLCQGENFINKESWRDPCVSYRKTAEMIAPVRPNGDKALWRNFNDLIDIPGNHAALVLRQYLELSGDDTASISVYGVETSNASYLSVGRYDLSFPSALAGNAAIIDLLTSCISASEELRRTLNRALKQVASISEDCAKLAVRQFDASCERRFWGLCDAAACEKSLRKLYIAWCDDISAFAVEAYDKTLKSVGLRARTMAEAEEQRKHLMYSIFKLKKEANK